METRPTEFEVHRVTPVPGIASAATTGEHASSKVVQEQDTSDAVMTD